MGAHAGVFFFDRRPSEAERQAVVDGLQRLQPEGVSSVAGDGAVVAYLGLQTWNGELMLPQPIRSSGGLVMAWDGRLDNRADRLLALGGARRADATDAAIALATFERFGIDSLRTLIGEWSLAIWDPRRRVVHLARDYMGVRPLYYYEGAGRFVAWSSHLGELASRVDRVDALEERFVARFMAIRHSPDVTPYQGIRAVPPAHCVSVSAERGETRRFWSLDPAVVCYRDRRLYEEHLRSLWRDAVGSRLRTAGTVWAELSGGLDSSSVVCAADALIREGLVAATAIQTISHVPARSPDGDERRFIAAVEAQIGVKTHVLIAEEHDDMRDPDTEWQSPFVLRGVGLASARLVRAHGGGVVLSGRAGDAVMGGVADNSVAVLDHLSAGRPMTACVQLRQWSRATRKPIVEIGWNLLRACAPRWLMPHSGHTLNETQRRSAALLTNRLQRLLDESPDAVGELRGIRRSKRRLAELLLGYAFQGRLNVPQLPPDLTYAYPFLHRPLVEFVMAIPGDELSAPGETRSLMRRAFDGLVPSRVLQRRSKGHYAPSVMRSIRPLAAEARPVDRLEVVQRSWIDPQRLDAALGSLIHGGAETGGEVRSVLQLEQWLQSRHRRGPAVIRQREEVNIHDVLNA